MNTFRLKTEGFELELSGERDFVEGQLKRLFGDAEPLAFERVRDDFRPNVIPFEDFLKLKEPQTPMEHLVTLAYYFEKYLRQDSYTQQELADKIGDAWTPEVLAEAVAEGWLEDRGDESYTLTFSGEQYVQGGF